MEWFSTKVRVVCLIENTGAVNYMDCVHLFRATDYADAEAVALRLGRTHEKEYKNGAGELVRWRLKEVVSLDQIGTTIKDGAEVSSEFRDLEPDVAIAFDAEFRPEDSLPTNSI